VLSDCVSTPDSQSVHHSPPVRLIECILTGMPTRHYDNQVAGIPKVTVQDTTLTVSNVNGGKTTFPVPSGTHVELHVPGLHYNRTLVAFCHGGQVLMRFYSTILERATQVHARAVPWRLAEGRIHSIQPRYILPIEELPS
jgi:hypothetical protein